MDDAAAQSHLVRIQLHGHCAVMDAAYVSAVVPVLHRSRRRFVAGGPTGHCQQIETTEHFVLDDDQLVFSAGLLPRIRKHLEQLGHTVQLGDRTTWEHLRNADMQVTRDPNLWTWERDLLKSLSTAPRGQILVGSPSKAGRQIGLMSRLFRQSNMLAVSANRTSRERLVCHIAQHTDRPATAHVREAWGQRPRLLVVTLQLAQYVGGDDFDVIVFADDESALSDGTHTLCAKWPHATWYACVQDHQVLHENERFHLEEVFGAVIVSPGDALNDGDVTVVLLPMSRAGSVVLGSGLLRKRRNYWNNLGWNNAIAATASKLAMGEPTGIPRSLLPSGAPRVAIIVESTEHGRRLQALLPSWELRTIHDYVDCIPCVTGCQIATLTYAATYGISADVIVRADGGAKWPLEDVHFYRNMGSTSRTLVVDFVDNCDAQAVRDTRSRRTAYERRGWMIETVAMMNS